ncbi:transketolase C-terminal domain-containing protein [Streptomyces vilmorinianum]|uniref:transketolase C-terminal domain-containing protein n=1 Tax=Streptomyces vilmorinianum TaxID=3051092 RepID=UPI0020C7C64F|nr:transketolase C-terminal domain-containing protein [Streptomyces vilmorinianum]
MTEADFTAKLPLEGVRFVRRGTDVSLLSYGAGLSWTLAAAEELAAHGCSAEVIDLRALDSPAMDWKTLVSAVSRTGAAVFVDPAAQGQAIGPRVIAELVSRHRLQLPMDHVACADVQPVAAALERQATAGVPEMVHTVRRLLEP